MDENFFLINEEIKSFNQPQFFPAKWLDDHIGIGEYCWFLGGKIPLLLENIQLLKEESEILFDAAPSIFNNPTELQRLLIRLINKNKAFKSGLIMLAVKQGIDLPVVTAKIQKYGDNNFILKGKSLLLNYSNEIKYSGNKHNSFRFYNQSLWASVNQEAKYSKTDGFIIQNEKKEMVEVVEGNLYFICDDVLYTPSPETGCYLPAIRNKVLEASSRLGMKIVETTRLNDSVAKEMDEAFIAGEALAMQKIMGIGVKRFTHQKTAKINEALNRILLSE